MQPQNCIDSLEINPFSVEKSYPTFDVLLEFPGSKIVSGQELDAAVVVFIRGCRAHFGQLYHRNKSGKLFHLNISELVDKH